MDPKKDLVNLLDVVPNEIWEACWNLTTRDDLKNLSCVCRRFQPICQSLLFRSFHISISRIKQRPMFSLSESNMTIIEEKIERLHGVLSNKFLVDSVHELMISTIFLESAINGANHLLSDAECGEAPLSLFLTAVFTTLPIFSKTKVLILKWPIILSGKCLDLVLTLAARCLPIEDLTLIMEDIPSRNFDEFPFLKVLALGKPSYIGHDDPQCDSGISFPTSVKYLYTKSMVVAPKLLFGLDSLHPNLISFELLLGRRSFPLLLQCLSFCPQMKYLVIHASSRTTCSTPLQLPEANVPKLQTFIGPLELALAIVPNRPISCLGIIEEPWMSNEAILRDMTQLARNTGPVTKLSFTLQIHHHGTLSTIMNLFPSLSLLNIGFHDEGLSRLSDKPDEDVRVKDGRLEVQKPWNDSDSLENHLPVRRLSGYKGLVYDVALGRLQLPSTLEILRLDIHLNQHYMIVLDDLSRNVYYFEPFTFRMAQRVVYALAKHYSQLRQVHIGSKKSRWLWVKNSEQIWQAQEEGF